MQYDAKAPTEYLKMLEADWRKDKLLEMRKLFKKHGPELQEGITWGVLAQGRRFLMLDIRDDQESLETRSVALRLKPTSSATST